MTAEGHLPGRESEERQAVRRKIASYPAHELLLVHDMLYHIVADYQVKLSFHLLYLKDIRSQKAARCTFLREELLRCPYFTLSQVHAQN